MKKTDKRLFSKETLDTIAMSRLYGGENNNKCDSNPSCIQVDCGCPTDTIPTLPTLLTPECGDTISLPPQPNPLCLYCWNNAECPPPPTYNSTCGN